MVQEIRAQVEELKAEIHRLSDEVQTMQKSPIDKAFDLAVKVAIPVLIGIVGWIYTIESATTRMANRLEVVEKTRFTDRDGAKLLSDIQQDIRTNYPPKWLSDAVIRIEASSISNSKATQDINSRLIRLESAINSQRDK